jgi:ubiquinone/menaquinone biosynthesis C-methylase UbiE
MSNPASNFHFKVMAFAFKLRDFFKPRKNILEEAGIKPGFHVLDYGCGPGSYTAAASELAGSSGKVYALDIHPLAIRMVRDIASKNKLMNIETILSNCNTGLPDNSVDVVLLYDTFHDLSDSDRVMEELHRVLKSEGLLSFSDHHIKEQEIISNVTGSGLFKLSGKGKRTYSFSKEKK